MNGASHLLSAAEQQRPRAGSNQQLGRQRGDGTLIYTNGEGLRSPDSQSRIINNRMRQIPMDTTPFEGPRSPPNTKNTSHVPCKFFKSGQCQAGRSCPFLHSTDNTTGDTPCKYFAKGNCKFGAKCALAHILPDGRRVNRPLPNYSNSGFSLSNRGPGDRSQPGAPPVNPAINEYGDVSDPYSAMGMAGPGDYPVAVPYQPPQYSQIPFIETGFASRPESQYGSPPEGNRLPLSSPTAGHRSVLDAPMPASFDSQGISLMARYGPIAASMPSKVFLESPPSSLPRKIIQPSDTLRDLHDSAFARDVRSKGPELGSSPSIASADEGSTTELAKRMQIQRMPISQQNQSFVMSKSLPRSALKTMSDEWESEDLLFGAEEDLVPPSLHELLTPQERMRRVSRTEQDRTGVREAFGGPSAAAEHPSRRFGSPPATAAASPSRYAAFFARQKQEEVLPVTANGTASGPSPFGHVGSPLRNSNLHPGIEAGRRMTAVAVAPSNHENLDSSFDSAATHCRESSNPSSTSALTQQLSHTRLSSSPDGSLKTNGNAIHTSHRSSQQPPHVSSSHQAAAPSYSSILSKSTNSSSSSKTLTPPVVSQNQQQQHKVAGPQARIEEESQLGSDGGVFSMEPDEGVMGSGRRSQEERRINGGRVGNGSEIGKKSIWM